MEKFDQKSQKWWVTGFAIVEIVNWKLANFGWIANFVAVVVVDVQSATFFAGQDIFGT